MMTSLQPVFASSDVADFFGILTGSIFLYALLVIPLTIVCYFFGKLILRNRLEAIQNGLNSAKFESDTLRMVIGQTADPKLAEESLQLARYQVIREKADSSIDHSQDWPYDSLREGIFWRPVRLVAHLFKWLRIEFLALQVKLGLKKKSEYESLAIDRLESYERAQEVDLGDEVETDPSRLLECAEKEAEENLNDYEQSILVVREDAEESLVENLKAEFESARSEQELEFQEDVQELEDHCLEDDIQQRKLISNLLEEKERVLAGIRKQLVQADENRAKAKDERMDRVWKLLEEEK